MKLNSGLMKFTQQSKLVNLKRQNNINTKNKSYFSMQVSEKSKSNEKTYNKRNKIAKLKNKVLEGKSSSQSKDKAKQTKPNIIKFQDEANNIKFQKNKHQNPATMTCYFSNNLSNVRTSLINTNKLSIYENTIDNFFNYCKAVCSKMTYLSFKKKFIELFVNELKFNSQSISLSDNNISHQRVSEIIRELYYMNASHKSIPINLKHNCSINTSSVNKPNNYVANINISINNNNKITNKGFASNRELRPQFMKSAYNTANDSTTNARNCNIHLSLYSLSKSNSIKVGKSFVVGRSKSPSNSNSKSKSYSNSKEKRRNTVMSPIKKHKFTSGSIKKNLNKNKINSELIKFDISKISTKKTPKQNIGIIHSRLNLTGINNKISTSNMHKLSSNLMTNIKETESFNTNDGYKRNHRINQRPANKTINSASVRKVTKSSNNSMRNLVVMERQKDKKIKINIQTGSYKEQKIKKNIKIGANINKSINIPNNVNFLHSNRAKNSKKQTTSLIKKLRNNNTMKNKKNKELQFIDNFHEEKTEKTPKGISYPMTSNLNSKIDEYLNDFKNSEQLKKIKSTLDENLKGMFNFSYECFLNKESETESRKSIEDKESLIEKLENKDAEAKDLLKNINHVYRSKYKY